MGAEYVWQTFFFLPVLRFKSFEESLLCQVSLVFGCNRRFTIEMATKIHTSRTTSRFVLCARAHTGQYLERDSPGPFPSQPVLLSSCEDRCAFYRAFFFFSLSTQKRITCDGVRACTRVSFVCHPSRCSESCSEFRAAEDAGTRGRWVDGGGFGQEQCLIFPRGEARLTQYCLKGPPPIKHPRDDQIQREKRSCSGTL